MIAGAHPAGREIGARAWRWSGGILAAAVWLAPYTSWRPADIFFTVSDLLFLIGLICVVSARRLPLQPFGRATPLWLIGAMMPLFGMFIGTIANGIPDRWLVNAIQYVFSLVLLPMLLMGQGEARTTLLSRALVGGVVLMEAFGLFVYYALDLDWEQSNRLSHEFITGTGRLAAFLGDANWNAVIIVMTIPFVFYLRIRRRLSTTAFVIACVTLVCSLLLTASVTGLATVVIATLIFCLVGRIRIPLNLILGVAAALALFAASGQKLPRAFEKRVMQAVNERDVSKAGTFTGRAELIREAWSLADGHMIVGVGADQYRQISVDRAPVHNIFLLLWVEGGLIAVAGWVLLLCILAFQAARVWRQDPVAVALALSVFSTFLIFCAAAPHMYGRLWISPLLLAMAPCFALNSPRRFAWPHSRFVFPGLRWRSL